MNPYPSQSSSNYHRKPSQDRRIIALTLTHVSYPQLNRHLLVFGASLAFPMLLPKILSMSSQRNLLLFLNSLLLLLLLATRSRAFRPTSLSGGSWCLLSGGWYLLISRRLSGTRRLLLTRSTLAVWSSGVAWTCQALHSRWASLVRTRQALWDGHLWLMRSVEWIFHALKISHHLLAGLSCEAGVGSHSLL